MEYIAGYYDIVVVGAGHAGCEAALAAARLGMKTIVFAINLDSISKHAVQSEHRRHRQGSPRKGG